MCCELQYNRIFTSARSQRRPSSKYGNPTQYDPRRVPTRLRRHVAEHIVRRDLPEPRTLRHHAYDQRSRERKAYLYLTESLVTTSTTGGYDMTCEWLR